MALEEALDIRAVDDGARLGDELDRIGYAGPLPCPTAAAPHAYVELHIEQGPILEDEGITIGVVEGVQGISWTELTITGRSAHAGTTPMRMRRDAGYVAAAIATFAPSAGDWARRRPGGDRRAGSRCAPTSSTSCRTRRCSRSTCATPTTPCCARPRPRSPTRSRRLAAAEGVTVGDPLAGPLRARRLRPGDRRPRRGDGPPARPLDAADAERRRPRRPDARPHLPGGDDLHAERRRAVAQHRRAHPPGRRHRRRRRAPADAAGARRRSTTAAPSDQRPPVRPAAPTQAIASRQRRRLRTATGRPGWPTATVGGRPTATARGRSPTPTPRQGRGGPPAPSAPAVSNGQPRPSGLNGSCRLSPPAATTTPASRSACTAVRPRGIACWWPRPWR